MSIFRHKHFAISFVLFCKIFVTTKILIYFRFKFQFGTRIMPKLVKHKNPEIVNNMINPWYDHSIKRRFDNKNIDTSLCDNPSIDNNLSIGDTILTNDTYWHFTTWLLLSFITNAGGSSISWGWIGTYSCSQLSAIATCNTTWSPIAPRCPVTILK